MNEIVKLSKVINQFADGRGLVIASDMKASNKRFLYGQPQLRGCPYALGDSSLEALDNWLKLRVRKYVDFPDILIEYDFDDLEIKP